MPGGRKPKSRFLVFFGSEDPELLRDIETWRPLTVGCYPSKKRAIEAISTDEASPWHADEDFTMLYEGVPGGDLKFVGMGKDLREEVKHVDEVHGDTGRRTAARA